ncbi:MAG TPA: hypothetical protein VL977_05425 [Solirubrobacteraceae bacterium]|nr:hypothetical protein [Solirubrobacteraceae bacterium]
MSARPSPAGQRIPYPRFRAALDAGDLPFIRTHRAAIGQVALPDALRICLLIREQDPERFARAAAVWVGRLAQEGRTVLPEHLRLALDAFDELARDPNRARERLSDLCAEHGLR